MRAIYPWNAWLSRSRPTLLRMGRDYRCGTKMMAQQIRNAAVKRSKLVSLRVEDDVIVLRVKP